MRTFSLSKSPENPMFDMNPNALIWGARNDRMMEGFGGTGLYVDELQGAGAGQLSLEPGLAEKAAAIPLGQLTR